jgi:hypothetical protein
MPMQSKQPQRNPVVIGLMMIAGSIVWLLGCMLLGGNTYLTVIPFAILFFGGFAVVGCGLALWFMGRW